MSISDRDWDSAMQTLGVKREYNRWCVMGKEYRLSHKGEEAEGIKQRKDMLYNKYTKLYSELSCDAKELFHDFIGLTK